MARTSEECLEIDALGSLIYQARKDGIDIADTVWSTGYRLDPYPNGKSKDELIELLTIASLRLDKSRGLLRSQHQSFVGESLVITMERHRELDHFCPVCKFLDETSLVKS